MTAKGKLYAARITKRVITILDVPQEYREEVMALLPESDRKRQEDIMQDSTGQTPDK